MIPRPKGHSGPYILIHTDGSCLGNPGPGGHAAVLRRVSAVGAIEARRAFVGHDAATTNNRMELLAAIRGLQALKRDVLPVVVVTDSQYVRKGITVWINGWRDNGWMTSARQPVKNADLWQELDRIAATQRVEWKWCKGHSGDPFNEEADRLSREEAELAAALLEA